MHAYYAMPKGEEKVNGSKIYDREIYLAIFQLGGTQTFKIHKTKKGWLADLPNVHVEILLIYKIRSNVSQKF